MDSTEVLTQLHKEKETWATKAQIKNELVGLSTSKNVSTFTLSSLFSSCPTSHVLRELLHRNNEKHSGDEETNDSQQTMHPEVKRVADKLFSSIFSQFSSAISNGRIPLQTISRLSDHEKARIPKECKAPICSVEDFFQSLSQIADENSFYCNHFCLNSFTFSLHVPSIEEQQRLFHVLSPIHSHLGIDDLKNPVFLDRVESAGVAVLRANSTALALRYCGTGVPKGMKAQMWKLALNTNNLSNEEIEYVRKLAKSAIEEKIPSDRFVKWDWRQTCGNDDDYFVFEDQIVLMVRMLIRDESLKDLNSTTLPLPQGYPLNGVPLISGLVYTAAPIAYLYTTYEDFYPIFRALYRQYFSRLLSVNDDEYGIIAICNLFETLIFKRIPQVVLHLQSILVNPISLVFKWIIYAFAGYLPVNQLLGLWERMISFGRSGTLLLGQTSAAIICTRAHLLLSVRSQKEAFECIADPSRLNIIALLQEFVFSDE